MASAFGRVVLPASSRCRRPLLGRFALRGRRQGVVLRPTGA